MNEPSGYFVNLISTYLQDELALPERDARHHADALARLTYARAAAEGIAEATKVRGQYQAQREAVIAAEVRAVQAHEALRYYALGEWDGGRRAVQCIGSQR